MSNANLHRAKKRKNDEFYTRFEDVEKELAHYPDAFRGKVVYCNCDDYRWSAFPKYFKENFHKLGVKRLIATCFNGEAGEGETPDLFAEPTGRTAWHYEFDGETETVEKLNGNGAFQSRECVKLLKECDIVCTNPPFSLFGKFFATLIENGVDFIVLGHLTAILKHAVFPHLKSGRACVEGINHLAEFIGSEKRIAIGWYSTLKSDREKPFLELTATYTADRFPKLDNYDAINVDRVAEIPCDYDGVMAVPIAIFDKLNTEQFDVKGIDSPVIDGDTRFRRIFIKRKNF